MIPSMLRKACDLTSSSSEELRPGTLRLELAAGGTGTNGTSFEDDPSERGSASLLLSCAAEGLPLPWSLFDDFDNDFCRALRMSRKPMLTFCRAISLETSIQQPDVSSLKNRAPESRDSQTMDQAIMVLSRFDSAVLYSSRRDSIVLRKRAFPGWLIFGHPLPNRTSRCSGHSIPLKALLPRAASSCLCWRASHLWWFNNLIFPVLVLIGSWMDWIPNVWSLKRHSVAEPSG